MAFSAGLWLGVTLSFGETTAFAGLLVGAVGLGLGGSRLLSNRLRRQRLRRRESRRAGENQRRVGARRSRPLSARCIHVPSRGLGQSESDTGR